MQKIKTSTLTELEDYRKDLAEILNANKTFKALVFESGDALKAWKIAMKKRFWFQYFMMRLFKLNKEDFFSNCAQQSNIFIILMDFLRSMSHEQRKDFFRHLFLRYHSLNHYSIVCFMWLDSFCLDEKNPKYEIGIVATLLMSYEESLFSGNHIGVRGDENSQISFKNSSNSPYDIKDYGYFQNSSKHYRS